MRPLRDQSLRSFRRIAWNLDTSPILRELDRDPAIWVSQTGRQLRAPAQVDTQAIPVRGLRRSRIQGRRRRDVHESRYTRLAKRLPETVRLLESFARELGGDLGRARIAKLQAGKQVLPHVDRGEYYRVRDRYHLVLRSSIGSLLRAGGEQARLQERELWWFDNHAVHDACNDGSEDRIHLIFDLRLHDRQTAVLGATSDRIATDLPSLLADVCCPRDRPDVDQIAHAVELYATARERPEAWQHVLRAKGLRAYADLHPISALARIVWPDAHGAKKRCLESAIAWSLAQLDLDRQDLTTLPDALRQAGGLRSVDRLWSHDRDRNLYDAVAPGDSD